MTAQSIQTLTIAFIVFVVALLGFGRWFLVSYWPKQLEKRAAAEDVVRKQALEKAENEIKHKDAMFQEELEARRQERLLERQQYEREADARNQILQGFLTSSTNSIKLSERYLDHSERMIGELAGHRTVLTDVSDTIDKIHADFEGLKSQMNTIVQGVQTSTTASNAATTAVNQMMQSIQVFGSKLDGYAQAVKGDTGKFTATNGSTEVIPQ